MQIRKGGCSRSFRDTEALTMVLHALGTLGRLTDVRGVNLTMPDGTSIALAIIPGAHFDGQEDEFSKLKPTLEG